jgi:hypothetical protein
MIKFDVVMAFNINAVLYLSDLKTLIGVDLSAWTAAFAPSLLSDPPRVFNSSCPPTKHGPPGDLLAVLGHAVRIAARLFRQLGRQGHSRAKRIGGFHGGGSFHGGLRGGNLSHLGGSVRAGRQDFRAID